MQASLDAKLRKAVTHPMSAARFANGVFRAALVRLSCRLRGVRFSAGRNFRVQGWLSVRGPGRVVFGDNVNVDRLVTPWTYTHDALIEVGGDSYVNGTRFGCHELIRIGPRAILSDARIFDCDYHSVRVDRQNPAAPIRVKPVLLGENVWLAAAVGVLPGTTIGDNSVVGFGAVCAGTFPPDSIIAGNPARVVKPVPPAPVASPDGALAGAPSTAPAPRAATLLRR